MVNFELAIHVECHGLTAAIRALPGLAGLLLRVRPTDAFRLVSSLYGSGSGRRQVQGSEWQSLASRMDTELDHIGSARLLASHTPHESCERTPPVEGRPLLSLSLVPLASVALEKLPLARPIERMVGAALTKGLETADRFLPLTFSGRLGLRGKSKTD